MTAKILVADDEANIIKLLRLYLREAGYEVVAARDGREALERFRAEAPDLVILDLMMPHLNGFDVCTEIRKDQAPGLRAATLRVATGVPAVSMRGEARAPVVATAGTPCGLIRTIRTASIRGAMAV